MPLLFRNVYSLIVLKLLTDVLLVLHPATAKQAAADRVLMTNRFILFLFLCLYNSSGDTHF